MNARSTEASFNSALAEALVFVRPDWRDYVQSEQTGCFAEKRALQADVIVFPDAIEPVSLESAFEGSGDIDQDAISRLGLTSMGAGRKVLTAIAVKIPIAVKGISIPGGIKQWLLNSNTLEYTVYWRDDEGQNIRFPRGEKNKGYISGTVWDLAEIIELAATPYENINQYAKKSATCIKQQAHKMAEVLKDEETLRDIAQCVGQPETEHALRVACAIWLDALVLHNRIAMALQSQESNGNPLRGLKEWSGISNNTIEDLIARWKEILNVNYHSVFKPAITALEQFEKSHSTTCIDVLQHLAEHAKEICELRLRVMGDIGADIFPRLAADRKETAAYYTLPLPAEMMATIGLNMGVPKRTKKQPYPTMADFASGTGTILKSVYRTSLRIARRTAVSNKTIDLDKRHQAIHDFVTNFHQSNVEHCLQGADIQPIAAHLTASGIASMAPDIPCKHSNAVCASVRDGKTGSIELMKSTHLSDMFTPHEGPSGEKSKFSVADGSLDCCFMNPPYTGGRGGRKLFNITGLSENERKESRRTLGELMKGDRFYNPRAGLGSAFAALAHKKLRNGGILGLILPQTATSSDGWRMFRIALVANYSDITVISTPKSFSADTGMGEIMVLARKTVNKRSGILTVVNLKNNPGSFVEAHEMARSINFNQADYEKDNQGDLNIGEHVFATYLICPASKNGDPWGAVGSEKWELAKVAGELSEGLFADAGLVSKTPSPIPFLPLSKHVDVQIGPSHDYIGHPKKGDGRGAFKMSEWRKGNLSNLSLWKANCETQKTMLCAPTHSGVTVEGRSDLAEKMLDQQSKLFLSRGMRMTSQALHAALTEKSTMGGSAWAGVICPDDACAAYLLWFNSIFGMMTSWQHAGKQQMGRMRMQLADIKVLPCPDFTSKTPAAALARERANEDLPELKNEILQAACCAWQDPIRKKINIAVARMFDFLPSTLTQEQMEDLSKLWCADKSVHGNKVSVLVALRRDGILPAGDSD